MAQNDIVELCQRADRHAVPENRLLQNGAFSDHAAGSDPGVFSDGGSAADSSVRPDPAGALESSPFVNLRVGCDPDAGSELFPLNRHSGFPIQQGSMGPAIFLEIPDIAPELWTELSINAFTSFQEEWPYLFSKIKELVSGDERKYARFENVDSRIHMIAKHVFPSRLFNELPDASIRSGHCDPVIELSVDWG